MTGFLLRRLAASLLLLYLVLTLTFVLLRIVPGDPTNDLEIPRQQREQLRKVYHLDRPLGEQYLRWLNGVVHGDFGVSFSHHRPVAQVLLNALPNTLILAGAAFFWNAALGLVLGIAAARNRGRPSDHLIRVGSLLLYSLPVFWLSLMVILLFSYVWPVFPASNMHSVAAGDLSHWQRLLDLLHHLVLPSLVLGAAGSGATTRFVRNGLLEVLDRDYIRTARAKGLSERRVMWIHAMRNSLVPLTQVLGLTVPTLLNGALITEIIFSWPGIGQVTLDGILSRDYPLVLATTIWSGIMVILGNFLADLLHAVSDPRVRHA